MKRTDLIETCRALSTECEVLRASNEARGGVIASQVLEIEALRTEIAVLSAQLQPLTDIVVNAKLIANRGELIARMREMSKEGVPCHMQGDFVRHSRTGAVLAQVGQPYPLRG
jgi:pyridoxal biosynthesis lyase PdxS